MVSVPPEPQPHLRAASKIGISFAISALALVLFGWLAEEVFEGDMTRFDAVVRATVHGWSTPHLTAAMQVLTFLGSVLFIVSATLLLCLLFWWYGWRREALRLAVAMLGAAGLDEILKHAFRRPRPVPFFGPTPHTYSFPSGHSLSSLCFYGVLAGLMGSHLRQRGWRLLLWVLALLLAGAIGLSRIYLGVHYPTDVVAGFLAALMWIGGLLGVPVDPEIRNVHPSSPTGGVE